MVDRLTQEEYRDRIREITRALHNHLGRKVLLIVRDGRIRTAIIATLRKDRGKICAKYRNYAKDGSLTALRSMYVNPLLVYTGDLTLDYFDDGV